MKSILGKKLDMSQIYAADGTLKPVTAVQVGPCYVTGMKTQERDGYTALQFGYGEKKRVSRALSTQFSGVKAFGKNRGFRYVREERVDSVDGVEKGDMIDATQFAVGEKVQVIGWSKGRGYAGVVKRHGFRGHPPTHGHKDQERMPGSIGSGGVQHVFKGMRMAGRMGCERVTVKGLDIIAVDYDKGILYIKGAIPGARNGFVIVRADGIFAFKKQEEKRQEENAVSAPSGEETAVAASAATVASAAGADEATDATPITAEGAESDQADAAQEAAVPKPEELSEDAPSQIEEVERLIEPHVHEAGMTTDEIQHDAVRQEGSPQEEAEQSNRQVASADELPTDVDEATGEVKPQE